MDPSDKQQRRRVQTAAAAQRYRNKNKTGQPVQHRNTLEEQQQLLSLPYHTLSDQQKGLVRHYRRQIRMQAHLVASRMAAASTSSLPPIPIISQLTTTDSATHASMSSTPLPVPVMSNITANHKHITLSCLITSTYLYFYCTTVNEITC